jgi:protein involved in polysaccharide export with SLBB domain
MRSNHLLLTFALSVPMALVTLSCDAQSSKKAYVQLSGSGPIKSTVQLDDQVPILIGDQLTFRILEDEDPAVTLPVNDSGQVQVPYIGNVSVVNKTSRAVALEIQHALEESLYKKATVLISLDKRTVRSPGKIYLTGEVAKQGPLEISPDEPLTVSRAILQAGGFSDFANKRKVRLIRKTRGSQQIQIVDIKKIIEQGRVDLDLTLNPGDVILVPARIVNW